MGGTGGGASTSGDSWVPLEAKVVEVGGGLGELEEGVEVEEEEEIEAGGGELLGGVLEGGAAGPLPTSLEEEEGATEVEVELEHELEVESERVAEMEMEGGTGTEEDGE
jgi:hypothetical protein